MNRYFFELVFKLNHRLSEPDGGRRSVPELFRQSLKSAVSTGVKARASPGWPFSRLLYEKFIDRLCLSEETGSVMSENAEDASH